MSRHHKQAKPQVSPGPLNHMLDRWNRVAYALYCERGRLRRARLWALYFRIHRRVQLQRRDA